MSMAVDFINSLKLFLFIQKSHLKTAFLNKGDAFVNVLMMIINNFAFVFMWWVIFNFKPSINGWDFRDILLLNAVANNSFAFFAIFARGIQKLPEYIDSGSLDSFLVSPRSPLFMISSSESTFANWGDFITGLLCWILSGYTTISGFILMLYASFAAFVVLYSFRLILSALAFFANDTQRLGDNIFMAMIIFANQPATIFTGWYKLMFLTVLPAGFISLLPVTLMRGFSFPIFAALTGGAVLFFLLARTLFYRGLRRYSSGNRFGVR